MINNSMNSLQRVLTTLSHQEPDRLPFFLLLSLHGAKELGTTIKDYFSRADHVVEGQLLLRKKYGHDCIYSFFYAAVETEAWGGDVIYYNDGPPNSGSPFINNRNDIRKLLPPRVKETPCLVKVLQATRLLKERVGDDAPIIGVVMSPFSLPVMQMGFAPYLDLIYEEPQLHDQLMKINEEFCVAWANAQLEAGATAICYFDPVSSPTIIPPDLYLKAAYPVAQRTLNRIKGPTATHLASGRSLPIMDHIVGTGTSVVGVSALEDLKAVKDVCRGKLTVLGNLNGLEMIHWDKKQAETAVKEAIIKAGAGGGFILSDNHGEIPWHVSDDVLMAISETVHTFGYYPLRSGIF